VIHYVVVAQCEKDGNVRNLLDDGLSHVFNNFLHTVLVVKGSLIPVVGGSPFFYSHTVSA